MPSHAYGPFTVEEFISPDDFKMVDFDPKKLDSAFAQNPGLIAFFGHQLGKAKRQLSNFKTRRDAVMSGVSRRLRDASTENGKVWAESRIESEMRSDKEFLQVSFAYNHALEVETTLEALYWAARGRKHDMEFFARRDEAEVGAKGYRMPREAA